MQCSYVIRCCLTFVGFRSKLSETALYLAVITFSIMWVVKYCVPRGSCLFQIGD